jgi:hypothetical protein
MRKQKLELTWRFHPRHHGNLNHDQLQQLGDDVGGEPSLLVMSSVDRFPLACAYNIISTRPDG